MRRSWLIAALLLLAASPAAATGGFDCRTTDGSDIGLSGAIGHVAGSPLGAATLRIGRRTLATADAQPEMAIGRSWIDGREIRADLADPQATRFEAELRAHRGPARRDRHAGPRRADASGPLHRRIAGA